MRGIRALVAFAPAGLSCAFVVACSAFGASDSRGGGGGGGGGADDAGSSADTGDSFAADGGVVGSDASADAAGCVTFVVQAESDTYLVDDGSHCNGPVTYGNAQTLQVTSKQVALLRFAMPQDQAAAIDGNARVTIAAKNASCSAGSCGGSAFAARSDWAEGAGDTHGADLCRRDFPSSSWGGGSTLTLPIAQPADYDGVAAAPMQLVSGAWTSAPIKGDVLAARMAIVGPAYKVSVLVTVASPVGALTIPAHDAVGGEITMSVTRCP